MIIQRERYVKRLKDAIYDPKVKCIVLDGPRHAGKTTLLKHIYHDDTIEEKKYYFAFDDQISTKQFKDSQEFMSFMQIRFGIDFTVPNLLFLNEIQYSKNIGSIIHDLINVHKIRTKIVATGITQGDYKEFLGLREKDFAVINIYTLDFMEFLEFKGIHTEHLDPMKLSRILFDEIQPLLLEFLKRGGYPSVVVAKTEEEKKDALKHIIQTVIAKDVNFWFRKEEIHYFEDILHIINDQHARIHNKRSIKKSHDIPATVINKYTRFLENHFLIVTLPHFFSDKTKEVSHKKKSIIMDMGLKNYLNDSFTVSVHDPRIMGYIALQEIEKNMDPSHHIFTYKKINGSEIDFLITDTATNIPVVIGDKNTDSTPKVFAGFEELYGKHTPEYIKTSLSTSTVNYLEGKPVYIMPYFLIGKYLAMRPKNGL